jgi:uncharacterized protein YcfJ
MTRAAPRFARTLLVACLVLPGMAPGAARALPADENITHGYAQVLRATPVYAMQRVRVPGERCDGERGSGSGSRGAIAGAVVGGALGNQVGKGTGRKAATVAGAVLGGAIGRHAGRANGVPACQSADTERVERRVVGYDVEYLYKGETYMSRLPADPGNRLRVRVSVVPDDPAIGR